MKRRLVVGLGNRDRGDDAVGPRVAERLRGRLPAGVDLVVHAGGGLDLLEVWEGCSEVVVVDAVRGSGPAGDVVRLDASREPVASTVAPASSHGIGLAEAVELARSLDRLPERLIVVGVEAGSFEPGAALSPALEHALARAADTVLAVLEETPCDA